MSNNNLSATNIDLYISFNKLDLCVNYISESIESLMPIYVKPILILDLDETLIHSIDTNDPTVMAYLMNRENFLLAIKSNSHICIVFYRQYLIDFLNTVKQMYHIIVYTNAMKSYCDMIVMTLVNMCGGNINIESVCRNNKYESLEKSLLKINCDPKQTIIIDDRYDIWIGYSQNLILVNEFIGPENINSNYTEDNTLLTITKILRDVSIKFNININSDIRNYIGDSVKKFCL